METNNYRRVAVGGFAFLFIAIMMLGGSTQACWPPDCFDDGDCPDCYSCVSGTCEPPTTCGDCEVYDWEDCQCKDAGCSSGCRTGCCPAGGEPVYIRTGEFREDFTDLSTKGRAMTVEMTRSYGSNREFQSVFGYGWDINYDMRIYRQDVVAPWELKKIAFFDGKACRYNYVQNYVGSNYYWRIGSPDRYFLRNPATDTFTLVEINGNDYAFDANDQLASITDVEGNQIAFAYDPNGFMTTITDDLGRDITLTYNDSNLLETVTDFESRVWTYTYDETETGFDLKTVKGPGTPEYPDGLTTTYGYDAYHNLRTVTDPNGQVSVENTYTDNKVTSQTVGEGTYYFTYNTGMTTITDREGYDKDVYYNGDGELVKEVVWNAGKTASYTTEYDYDANFHKTLTKLPKGNCIAYVYDGDDMIGEYRKSGISEPNDPNDSDVIATRYTYDPVWAGKYATITDGLGNVTRYEYYAGTGLLKKVTYPTVDGNTPTVEYTYDGENRLETVTDEAGIVAKYDYYLDTDSNGWGRVKKVIMDANETEGLKLTTEYKYNALGDIVEVKDPNGNVTKSWYNNLRQLTQTQTPFEYITKYHYDKNGNVKKIERETGDQQNPWQTTQYVYDVLGNKIREVDPLNNVTIYGYNKNEDPNLVIDAEENRTEREYNERGLLWKVTDANSGITEFEYDGNGNLTKITDANEQETTYTYDDFDRLEKITYEGGSYEQSGYDKNGHTTSRRSRGGEIIYFEYDDLGRQTVKNRPEDPNIVFGYDGDGRVDEVDDGRTVANGGGLWKFGYTRIGQVNDVNYANIWHVGYEYDDMSRRSKLTYPDGMYIMYHYDEMGRLDKIEDANGDAIADFTYDKLSRMYWVDIENSTAANYEYDIAGRLQRVTNYWGDGNDPQIFDYANYDKVGNRLSMEVDDVEYGYKYDKLYELVDVNYPSDPNVNYAYDKLGNRTALAVAGGATTEYSPNALNLYASVGGTSYVYDANGNLTDDGTYDYVYDCENMLVEVRDGQTTIAEYRYDYMGRRIRSIVGETEILYVWDDVHIIAEYEYADSEYTLVRKYIYADGIDQPLCMINVDGEDETRYYYQRDGLGSISLLTNETGGIVEGYTYDAFGSPIVNTSAGDDENWATPDGSTSSASAYGNPFMFTAREYDAATGLYYHRFRYYHPMLGRFMQPDPIGYRGGINLYAYCENNPVVKRDPTGLSPARDKCIADCDKRWDEEYATAEWLQDIALAGCDALFEKCLDLCGRKPACGKLAEFGRRNCIFLCRVGRGKCILEAQAVYVTAMAGAKFRHVTCVGACYALYPD